MVPEMSKARSPSAEEDLEKQKIKKFCFNFDAFGFPKVIQA